MARDLSLDIRRVATFLEEADEQTICSWLLVGFVDQSFADLLPPDEIPIREQLKTIYTVCSAATQERFKRAVARAAAEWDARAHTARVLRELALLAAETRASAAIPMLRVVLDHHKLRSQSPAELKATTSTIIAVIGGFPGISQATAYLRHLFFSLAVGDEYRAQLLIALCEDSPEEYPHYLPRFIEAMNALGNYFVPELVFRKFVRVVSFETIASQLGALPTDTRSTLLDHISGIFYEVHEDLAPVTQQQFYHYLSDTLMASVAHPGRVSSDRGFMLDDVPDHAGMRANITDISAYLKSRDALGAHLSALADSLQPTRPKPTGTADRLSL